MTKEEKAQFLSIFFPFAFILEEIIRSFEKSKDSRDCSGKGRIRIFTVDIQSHFLHIFFYFRRIVERILQFSC